MERIDVFRSTRELLLPWLLVLALAAAVVLVPMLAVGSATLAGSYVPLPCVPHRVHRSFKKRPGMYFGLLWRVRRKRRIP